MHSEHRVPVHFPMQPPKSLVQPLESPAPPPTSPALPPRAPSLPPKSPSLPPQANRNDDDDDNKGGGGCGVSQIKAPRAPIQDGQLCFSDYRRDDDDDSSQPIKRRRSSPTEPGPLNLITSAQEDNAIQLIDKPEIPPLAGPVLAEEQPVGENSNENGDEDPVVSAKQFPPLFNTIIARNKKSSCKHCSQEACGDAIRGQKRKRSDA